MDSATRRPDISSCTSDPLIIPDMAAGNAENNQKHAAEDPFLIFQLLCAAEQVKDLLIVIEPHAAFRRVLAVHPFRKRHMERVAELLKDAAIGHTLARFP